MASDLPVEPGLLGDTSLGLSDEEAGHPACEPPAADVLLGDNEHEQGDGDDIDEEEE